MFAKTGGVAEAVKARLKNPDILKADVINGLDKAGMKKLKMYGDIESGKIKPGPNAGNLVEVMSCEGGCIAGPFVISKVNLANVQLGKYVNEAEQAAEKKE